ncbi:MAG: ABC transporter permease [Bacteroidales bacterium]|nr:ABC transporter permease [Bacteroidales bacterium]
MLRNYLISTIRNLIRQKGFSIINILGLTIGMAIAILIYIWVTNELSYDKFNRKVDNLYRLVQTQHYTSGPLTTVCMPGPIAKDIRDDIPEIKNSFMYYQVGATISYNEKLYSETVRLSDPEVFEMFDFEFLQGDPSHVFDDINSVVLTDKMAKKLFEDEDPMGKIIKYNNEHCFKVTGIIKETPENSSFRFDLCIPFEFLNNLGWSLDRYGWNSFYVYVELVDGVDYKQVNNKIKNYIIEKKADPEDDSHIDLFLFPLKKMHLHSVRGDRGDIQYIYIFSAIAIFILIIACINFMNLATARSAKRAREISIRKTVGAHRGNLINQFLSESMFISFIAMILAIGLVYLLLPSFNQLLDKELQFNLANFHFWLAILGITAIVGLLAGSYPAFYLSSFNPIKTMRGGITKGKGNFYFRRILVVFQFTLSLGLIICTLVVIRQLSYMQNNKLGMDLDNVMYLSMRGESMEKYDVFKTELLNNPNILSVSRASSIPFYIGSNSGGIEWEGKDTDEDILVGFGNTDVDYIETMGMKLIDGRYYSKDIQSDTATYVINEKAAKAFNMQDPVGKWIRWGDENKYRIIGVVEDFHHLPMQYEIDPLVLAYSPERCRRALIKTGPANREDINEQVKTIWGKVFPGYPFEPRYLKDIYNQVYTDEATLINIIGYFAVLAIFISCLGLFALAAYMAEQRTKEIGIRKILGASVTGIVTLTSREFLKWVIISNIIAWPVAWFAMHDWLDSYTYHTKLSPDIFIYSLLISLFIALLTVSYQSIRSAVKKPVDAIKYE